MKARCFSPPLPFPFASGLPLPGDVDFGFHLGAPAGLGDRVVVFTGLFPLPPPPVGAPGDFDLSCLAPPGFGPG